MFQIRLQLLLQLIDGHLQLIEKRARNPIRLLKQAHQEMIVADFLVIVLRRKSLRGLQRLLHLLRETINTHAVKIWNVPELSISRSHETEKISERTRMRRELLMRSAALVLLKCLRHPTFQLLNARAMRGVVRHEFRWLILG